MRAALHCKVCNASHALHVFYRDALTVSVGPALFVRTEAKTAQPTSKFKSLCLRHDRNRISKAIEISHQVANFVFAQRRFQLMLEHPKDVIQRLRTAIVEIGPVLTDASQ